MAKKKNETVITNLLGYPVRDKISGFTGIVTGRFEYLTGCTRYGVQPPVGKNGQLPELLSFDESQLEVTGPRRVVPQNELAATAVSRATFNGGPQKNPERW